MHACAFRPFVHLALLGLSLVFSPAQADLVITGASTILPVAKRAAAEFTLATGIPVSVTGGGSDHGVQAALAGGAHIGMVSRKLHDDEAAKLATTQIGLDAVAVFVHERNALKSLNKDKIANIYQGRLNHWREVDQAAPNGRIVRVGKVHGRSTRELFDGFFGLKGQKYPADTHMIGANAASILYVSIDPFGISYVSVGSLNHAVKRGAPVKPLPIDGIAPTRENILSDRYPYTRPLNLVTRGAARGETLRFLQWMTSEAGLKAVEAEGFLAPSEPR